MPVLEQTKLPEPIGDSSGIVFQGALLVFGGGSGDGFSDSIFRIDPHDRSVTVIGHMPYAARGHQIVDLGDGSVLMIGGFNGATRADVHRIHLPDCTAERLADCPVSIAWFSAARLGDAVHILGGFTIPAGYLSGQLRYDIAADRWAIRDAMMPESLFPRGAYGANVLVAQGDRLVSVGGADAFDHDSGRANVLGTVAAFDPVSAQWAAQGQARPREGSAAVHLGDQLLLIGGMEQGAQTGSTLIERLDLATGEVVAAGRLDIGRLTPVAGAIDGQLVVAGGVTRPLDEMTDTVEVIELAGLL